jgi:3-oxoacyl-[acyl-carrier protein] reductase
MELKGRNALVTGAGRGIGRAIATALAKEGVNVGLVARTGAELERLAATLGAFGVRTSVAAADVGVRAEAEAAVASIAAALGGVDILINNAGIAQFGTVTEMDPAAWERIIQVNVLGVYYVTRAVLPGMIARGGGEIVNVASTAGQKGSAKMSAYAASKAALLSFTESLMPEVRKQGVRVTALLPSTVNTDLAVSLGLPVGAEDRMMQPEDVAEATLAALRLPARVFVRDMSILTTNPQ